MPTALVTPPWTPTDRDAYRFSVEQYQRLLDAGLVKAADEAEVLAGRQRFGVAQYHRMEELWILTKYDRVELLDGFLIWRPAIHPPHATATIRTRKRVEALLPPGWTAREQLPVTLSGSQPQPDLVVARGSDDDYEARHPGPDDIGLVVEVADSSLDYDRGGKSALYAADGIVEYWIVNINDRQVEVRTQPTPAGYALTQTYPAGQVVPLALDGIGVGTLAVSDVVR